MAKCLLLHSHSSSECSQFKLVWHQFSETQFTSHQFVWKVRSVQFRALGPSASVQFIPLSSRTLPALNRIDLADLQSPLARSSNWFWHRFSIAQFSSGRRGQVPPISSFSSVHELFRPWLEPWALSHYICLVKTSEFICNMTFLDQVTSTWGQCWPDLQTSSGKRFGTPWKDQHDGPRIMYLNSFLVKVSS